MDKYRKKPVVVEARRYLGIGAGEIIKIAKWGCNTKPVFASGFVSGVWDDPKWPLLISTPEGEMRCVAGDWIIKGIAGEFHLVKNEIFKATYEQVHEPVLR